MSITTTDHLDQIREHMLTLPCVGTVRFSCPQGLSNLTTFINAETGEELDDVLGYEMHGIRDQRTRVILLRYANIKDHSPIARVIVEAWVLV